jgi:hypothetical protein
VNNPRIIAFIDTTQQPSLISNSNLIIENSNLISQNVSPPPSSSLSTSSSYSNSSSFSSSSQNYPNFLSPILTSKICVQNVTIQLSDVNNCIDNNNENNITKLQNNNNTSIYSSSSLPTSATSGKKKELKRTSILF